MTGPGHPRTFDDKEKYYFFPEQLNTFDRFRRIRDFLRGKGKVSDKGLKEYIRTLLPARPEERKSSIHLLLLLTVDEISDEEGRRIFKKEVNDDETRRILQRIQKVCASI